MPTISQKIKLSTDELLQAAVQMKPREFEHFISQAIALRAKRRAPSFSRAETELMLKINKGLPERVQQRFDELVEKRQAETLTPEEHKELLRLVNRREKLNARRIELLGELAILRGVSLREVMKQLGIAQPKDV